MAGILRYKCIPQHSVYVCPTAQFRIDRNEKRHAMRTTLKIVLPLVVSVAAVSLLFAGYQVRTERKNLRTDLARRAEQLGESLQEAIEPQFEKRERGSERAIQ